MGDGAMNTCNGKPPKKTNPSVKPGLCKHLASLSKYLQTKLEENEDKPLAQNLDEIAKGK
jgi:hypothetical protein